MGKMQEVNKLHIPEGFRINRAAKKWKPMSPIDAVAISLLAQLPAKERASCLAGIRKSISGDGLRLIKKLKIA